MATVQSFLQRIQRESGDIRPDPVLSIQWLQDAYQKTLSRVPYQFQNKEAFFSTVAAVTAGNVSVANGSTTITETTSNANGWTSALNGRYFRVRGDTEFYLLSGFSDANPDTLTLDRVYEGTTDTDGAYDIFQRFYSLASDVGQINSVNKINNAIPLIRTSQVELDNIFPARPGLGEPEFYAPAGLDSSGNIQIELYRIPSAAKGYMYHYTQSVPTLDSGDDTIANQVPFDVLRAGWMSSYWAWRAALENPAPHSNQMRVSFEAEFEKRLQELLITEMPNVPRHTLRFPFTNTRHRWQRSKIKRFLVHDDDA